MRARTFMLHSMPVPVRVGQGRAGTMSRLRSDALGPNLFATQNVTQGSFQGYSTMIDLRYLFEFVGDPGRNATCVFGQRCMGANLLICVL
jgi:hypothetical protein